MVSSQKVGWLGVGRMGAVMAGRLLQADVAVTVWNRTRAKCDPLVEQGAAVADSIAGLAGCDVVFVMVSAPGDLEEVVLGDQGLLSAEQPPRIVVDCSSIDVETSARVRAALEAAGSDFLAAPVSGNPQVVAGGGSLFAVSGPEPVFAEVAPLLELIGKGAVYTGPDEQARVVKIAHNLYLGMLAQALSEVTVLAEKSGVPRPAFLGFLNSTGLGTDWARKRTPDLLALDWTPMFSTELLRKDFDLGLMAAREQEVPMPLAAATMQLIQSAIGHGFRDSDFLSLFAAEAASAGLDIEPIS